MRATGVPTATCPMAARRGVMGLFHDAPMRRLFGGETAALPVDCFRVLIGLLSAAYFLNTFFEAPDFSGPDGLLDHALLQDVFWFTQFSLFRPGLSLGFLQGLFLAAAGVSLGVVAGWRPKGCAAFLFVIAVSTYRWNYLVNYVEDGIMHLMLFWLLLLPIGRTLTLGDARSSWNSCWSKWAAARVPGTAVGFFLCNVALVYVVAGFWKWTSPMWRDGSALYAVLQLPVSHHPELWVGSLPWLKLANWAALVAECAFPLALLLPRGHWLKWVLLAGMIGFHGGIIGTMRLPLANLACLAAGVLIFREEIMSCLGRREDVAPSGRSLPRVDWTGRMAGAFVAVLSLAMLRGGSAGGPARIETYDAVELAIDPRGRGGLTWLHKPVYGALWLVGIAQQYQLFDWIDERNYRFRYTIQEREAGGTVRVIDADELFPRTNRSALLQCYLHDVPWNRIPPHRTAEVKRSLALGFARRYCRNKAPSGLVTVQSAVERITGSNPFLPERGPFLLFSFSYQNGEVLLHETAWDGPLLHSAGRIGEAEEMSERAALPSASLVRVSGKIH